MIEKFAHKGVEYVPVHSDNARCEGCAFRWEACEFAPDCWDPADGDGNVYYIFQRSEENGRDE